MFEALLNEMEETNKEFEKVHLRGQEVIHGIEQRHQELNNYINEALRSINRSMENIESSKSKIDESLSSLKGVKDTNAILDEISAELDILLAD